MPSLSIVEEETDEAQPALGFSSVVRLLLIVRTWVLNHRKKLRAPEEDTKVNELIESVFKSDVIEEETPKPKGIKKLFFWSYDDTSTLFYFWTIIVFFGCLFNLVMIVVMVFEEVSKRFYRPWIQFNLLFDMVFFVDLWVLTRKEYIEHGVKIRDVKNMLLHRVKTKYFIYDIICILPTDLLLFFKSDLSLSRLNRLLKCYRLNDLQTLTEIRTNFPNLFRVVKLMFTCFIIFHWNGCVYFFLSVLYDFHKARLDDWIFSYDKIPDPIFVTCDIFDRTNENYCDVRRLPPLGMVDEASLDVHINNSISYWHNKSEAVPFANFTKQYGLSFYWSALTLVTLGEQPWPNTTFQNSFEIGDTLLGLVIFAVIVGDIGNMVFNMNLKRSLFEDDLDGCKRFMVYRKVPMTLQRKAVEYFTFMWNHGGAQVDEDEIAEFLPPRLYGQLAVHIHMETLRKVKLFEDCNPSLLYELILQLQKRVYSPKDYICNKGEVGTEMYIVNQGQVEVVSEDGMKVFVQLGEGTVFGELSILNIPGNKNGNRRTANVRSVGYSDLYVLSKEALWEALRQYPNATESLLLKGKQLLAKDNLLDEDVVEELDVDPDDDVDKKLSVLQQMINNLNNDMNIAMSDIHYSHDVCKRRLTHLERIYLEDYKTNQ